VRRRRLISSRSIVTTLLAVALGGMALWTETDGLRALTAESARRLAVADAPVVVPPTHLELATGEIITFADLAGDTVFVDFIYTRCPTLCVALGTSFARLQAAVRQTGRDDLRLLSISFDPEYDTPEALRAYGEAYGVDMRLWSLARITDGAELKRLLTAFGIVVIPDEFGGFTHNAAIHLVDRQGRLARIYDQNDVDAALTGAETWQAK
jgi:protein SCO1/2